MIWRISNVEEKIMKPLTRVDMDNWVSAGCSIDGAPEDTLFMHARCHTDVPLHFIHVAPDAEGVCCLKCGKPVCLLSVKEAKRFEKCCLEYLEDVGWMSYTKGSGVVKCSCYFCKKEIAHLTLN